jgi:DNA-binding NtrC family response regulator
LVVDDEASIRDLLAEFFRKRGYKVSTASNPKEALSLTDSVPLNLVILDVLLDDKDGMEVLEDIKEKHPNLPVIIMTGIGYDEELLKEARDKGAAGYLSKTLPLDQLLMEVHRILNHFK